MGRMAGRSTPWIRHRQLLILRGGKRLFYPRTPEACWQEERGPVSTKVRLLWIRSPRSPTWSSTRGCTPSPRPRITPSKIDHIKLRYVGRARNKWGGRQGSSRGSNPWMLDTEHRRLEVPRRARDALARRRDGERRDARAVRLQELQRFISVALERVPDLDAVVRAHKH